MKRILVIDDNPEAADLLVSILDLEGYLAKSAYGGVAGLNAVSDFSPHVVFLDISMPDLNGFEVATQIRASKVTQPYLIAFSALSDSATIARAFRAGFNQHIAKTSKFEVLINAVRGVEGDLGAM